MNKYDEFYKRVLNNDGNADDTNCGGLLCKECILTRNNVNDGTSCDLREDKANIKIIKDYFKQKGENEMKEFNWEEFKQGKFAVHCDTEDKANDFLRECDKQGFKWSTGKDLNKSSYWNCYGCDTAYRFDIGIIYSNKEYYKMEDIKIIKWETKESKEMKKTFKEVIADIKEGQIWKWKMFTIELDKDKDIKITRIDGFEDCRAIFFNNTEKFTLQKPKYTFEQAIKAFKEGKTIIDNDGNEYNKSEDNDPAFLLSNIQGQWEIE